MPAQEETGLFCGDYVGTFKVPGSGGEGHTVTSDIDGAHCTCKGYRYRRDCRHVSVVFETACLWNCQWYEGGTVELRPVTRDEHRLLQDPDHRCPRCGGPTIPVRIA